MKKIFLSTYRQTMASEDQHALISQIQLEQADVTQSEVNLFKTN